MQKAERLINDLLVDSFNKITAIEKDALKKGPLNDLTINELHAIEAIGLEGGTMTETAKKLNVTVGTLTTMVNHLVKKEYVERVSNEEDRRIVKLMLTRKGKLGYRLHDRFHYVMIKNMLADINESEYEILIRALGALDRFIKETYEKI
ncbi:MAG: MarR family transcriptional regulator [Cellulosilyticum sp.]|nr:MarR family transcriptional regulator [Cellulosilyticum sp.]MEE1072754.1 MarR family transcriptional regulator [Cellulosilyticum sp.]